MRNRSQPEKSRGKLPETGVEPARPYGHKHLKLARLPIPPPGRLLPSESTQALTGVNLPVSRGRKEILACRKPSRTCPWKPAPDYQAAACIVEWFDSATRKNRGGGLPPAALCTSGNLGTSLRINQRVGGRILARTSPECVLTRVRILYRRRRMRCIPVNKVIGNVAPVV